ncbi:hypothetical protein HK104_011105 [Borealophlyctis nickersoniae]|nr:hypothetical protein HK104_011105 [Borealophlyctis nickersoniae]
MSESVRQAVISKYGQYANVPLDQISSFQANIDGQQDWVVLVTGVPLSGYLEDTLVLVSATPRALIFGRIDSARSRSTGIAIGLSVGMTILIAGLFVGVAAPLAKLSRAMDMLTQLDFDALEKGKLLSEHSLIYEIYRVQTTFATMVKAFAAGIRKNRDFMMRFASLKSGSTAGNDDAALSGV